MLQRQKKNEIKIMNIFFCLFLVAGNLIWFTRSEIRGISVVYQLVNALQLLVSCGVYGFAFVMGYGAGGYQKPIGTKEVFDTLKKLIVPYIAAVFAYWIVSFILQDAELKPVGLYKTAIGHHFCIVFLLIQFVLMALFTNKARRINPKKVLIVSGAVSLCSVLFIPQGISKYIFASYFFCYTLGFYFGENADAVRKYINQKFVKLSSLYFISFLVLVIITIIYEFNNRIPFVMLRQIITAIYNPVASVFVFALCTKISKRRFADTILCKSLSVSSYHIFIWHMLPIISVNHILHLNNESEGIGWFVIRTGITLIVMMLIVLINYMKIRRGKEDGTV